MFGVGTLGLLGTVPGNSGPSFDPAAAAFFARIPAQTPTRYALLNTVFVGLRAAGILALLDCLWLMAAADSTTARANLISGSFTLTPVAAPTFATDRGYTGDASSSYLNTNYTPSTAAGKLTQNSAHISLYDRTTRAAAAQTQMGALSTPTSIGIVTRFTGDTSFDNVNDTAGGIPSSANNGSFIADRLSSSTRTAYYNGSILGSAVSATSGAISTSPLFILARNAGGAPASLTSDQIAQASIGAGLGPTLAAQFYSIIQAYMTGVGAQV